MCATPREDRVGGATRRRQSGWVGRRSGSRHEGRLGVGYRRRRSPSRARCASPRHYNCRRRRSRSWSSLRCGRVGGQFPCACPGRVGPGASAFPFLPPASRPPLPFACGWSGPRSSLAPHWPASLRRRWPMSLRRRWPTSLRRHWPARLRRHWPARLRRRGRAASCRPASLRRQQRAPHADCVGAGTNRSRKPWWADNKHPLKSR